MPFDSRFFLVTALNPCLAVSAAGTVFAKSALKFRPLAVGFNGQIRKATPFSLDSALSTHKVNDRLLVQVHNTESNNRAG